MDSDSACSIDLAGYSSVAVMQIEEVFTSIHLPCTYTAETHSPIARITGWLWYALAWAVLTAILRYLVLVALKKPAW